MDEEELEIVREIWEDHGGEFVEPNVLIAKLHNRIYYTCVDDSKDRNLTVFTFISTEGMLYYCSKRRCNIKIEDNVEYYDIQNEQSFVVVGCPSPFLPEGVWVLKNIIYKLDKWRAKRR